MNIIIFLSFLGLAQSQATYITYASGNFTMFSYQANPSFSNCKNGASFINSIVFPGTFANTPQMIFASYFYDTDKPTPTEFTISIASLTKTQCDIKITCIQKYQIYRYQFNWLAIDDQRIEVINNLNKNLTGISSQDFTIEHSNMNALQGFVTVTSFGYKGSINFSLQITSITTTHVIVKFTTATTFLLSLGFQVILGTPEAFTQSDLITFTGFTSSNYYKSTTLTQPQGYTLLLPITAMYYANSQNIRLSQCYYTTTTASGTTISYTYQPWDVSPLASLTHKQVWINLKNTKQFYPFRLQKMRVSKIQSQKLDSNQWQLQVTELNQIFTNAATQSFLIYDQKKTLTMTYIYQCQKGKKVIGQIFYCPNCVDQYYRFSQYCYPQINVLTFYIALYQPDTFYQNIDLVVTSTGFQFSELILNQYSTTFNFMVLTVVDQ